MLTPLDAYVADGTIDLTNWNQGFVDTGKYNDQLYMISLGMTAQALYVNETYLNELGMELWPAEEDITWSEFREYLKEVQEKLPEDTYAALDIYNNNDLVWVWILSLIHIFCTIYPILIHRRYPRTECFGSFSEGLRVWIQDFSALPDVCPRKSPFYIFKNFTYFC